jgi:non-heme Fe2+,alpha-ketoglutarate-dependent halogenase
MFKEFPADFSFRLTDDELARFERDGWVGPYSLLTPDGVEALHASYQRTVNIFSSKNLRWSGETGGFDRKPWFKSLHAHVPLFCALASHPAIAYRLSSILGPDVMAWGVSATTRVPGQVHRWHVDVEHARWRGVSVFLGLKNACQDSSIKVISGSHKIDYLPQAMGPLNDSQVLEASRQYISTCQLHAVDLREGDFFIFDGRLWHGSHNTTQKVRTSVLAQYSRPDARIAIPMGWDEPIQWHSWRPPCVLVKGVDRFGCNRVIPPPVADSTVLGVT